jgi:uncharacterized repeat protein (TIGR01451 family)
MEGSENTVAPATAGRGRTMSWSSRVALLALAVAALFALPGLAQAANPSASLDQCANGSLAAPNVPACAPDEWVNGNLGSSKAHYVEGDSVPYRMVFDNLSTSGSHTVIIQWDTTKSDKHALDYLTTFNRTVTDANPCAGILSCGTPTTYPIPADTQVTGHPVTQIGGNFTLYGGTITGVGPYVYSPAGFTGDTSASIAITFTASIANPVLAWAGHIATRADWGPTNAATAIPGSPYHMRLLALDGSGGNQDRSLSADAVIFPGSITIVKDAVPNDSQVFSFTAGPAPLANFTLFDDGNAANNTKTFSGISDFQAYTVTEGANSSWTLSLGNPVCTVTSPNGGSQTGNAGTRTVSITLAEGENVSCTFTNTRNQLQPTIATTASAATTVGGSISDSVVLSGGSSPSGSITVKVYGPDDATCSNAALFTDVITVNSGNGTYASPTHVINTAGTYRFWASYSGDANNTAVAGACNQANESVVVSKAAPAVATTASAAVEVGGSISDSVVLSGGFSPTGSITVKVYGPNDATCSNAALFTDVITVNSGNGTYASPTHVINTAGTYRFWASYSGDNNNLAVAGACNQANESVVVRPASPAVATTASDGVEVGGSINDSVVLSGGVSPTGTITVKVYGPNDATCSGTALFTDVITVDSGNGTYASPTHVINTAGTYRFWASYSGDNNNTAVAGACNEANESVVVSKATPTLSTNASADVVIGGKLSDVAHLGGGFDPQGTITFSLYGPNNSECSGEPVFTDTVPVDGANDYTSAEYTAAAAGTYRWVASYSGDDNNNDVAGACGDDNESATAFNPSISITKNPKSQAIDAGGTANFTITVTNTGDIALSSVTVTDAQAPNCAKTRPDPLDPGQTWSYDCALAGVSASFTNRATVTGHPAVGEDVSATDTAPVTVNAVPPPPPPPPPPFTPPVVPTPPAPKIDLQITKADSPDPDVLGTQVRYLIVVKNNGPDTAHNVQMSDPLPFQVTFSSVSTTQGTCTGGQLVSCQLGTIANGASVTITVFVKTNETGIVTNTATTVGNEAETNTANNTASTTTLVKGPFTPPAAPTGCYAVAVAPHSLTAGKRSTLVLSVHMLGKPAKNARVRVTGSGISKTSGPTNAKGIVRMSVKPAKPGILKFQPVAHKGCALPRIGVIGAFTPPVTG